MLPHPCDPPPPPHRQLLIFPEADVNQPLCAEGGGAGVGKHFSVQCENLDNRADLLSWGGNPPLGWLDKASSQPWVPPVSHCEAEAWKPRALPSCPEDGPSQVCVHH